MSTNVSCCVWDYLVCVLESEYLKDSRQAKQCKKAGITNQGLWIFYNHFPENWHFGAVTYFVYFYFTEPFK